jgi:hypothetical protein
MRAGRNTAWDHIRDSHQALSAVTQMMSRKEGRHKFKIIARSGGDVQRGMGIQSRHKGQTAGGHVKINEL